MNKEKINQIFNSLPEVEPSNNLKSLIMQRIKMAEQKKAAKRLFALRFSMSVTSLAFALAAYYGGRELLSSQFWNIAMLGFSDFNLVLSNWQTFAWSLLETIPVSAISILLSPILILMLLGKQYENSAQTNKFNYLGV